MGSGWIMPDLDIRYGYVSINWPFFTKAELIAIWTAVLATPSHYNTINIYTDFQVAIDGISNGLKSNGMIRQYLKTPNSMLIEQIIQTATTKGQSLNFTKVKGHSGNFFNDIANDIAKQAATIAHQDNSHILDLVHSSMQSHLHFKPFWRNTPWDGKLRNNLTTLSALPYCADWANSKAISPWFDNMKNNTIPLNLLRCITNVVNINRIYFSPSCFVRWDYT